MLLHCVSIANGIRNKHFELFKDQENGDKLPLRISADISGHVWWL